MRRTLRVLAVGAVLVTALAACQPTGNPRCDAHAGVLVEADKLGYRYDCDPVPGYPLGWADHETRTLFVNEPRISHDGALLKVLLHEQAHAVYERQGRTFASQKAEECAADAWAKARMSADQRAGVGFMRCT